MPGFAVAQRPRSRTCGSARRVAASVVIALACSAGGAATWTSSASARVDRAVLAAVSGVRVRREAAGSPSATVGSSDCGGVGVTCRSVVVPLDWGRPDGSKLSLHVEVSRATGRSRGVMFLIAGGPGQAATQLFALGRGGFWQRLFPGYTLVTFDVRGTGLSDPIACAGPTESADTDAGAAAYVAACALALGPARDFYRTSANAMDLDAVRKALGFGRISLFGVSYGTQLALAYAHAFPTRVQRLVLDSVSSSFATSSVAPSVLSQLPATLNSFCARLCAGVTTDYGHDVVGLADSLAARPLWGHVLQLGGGPRLERLTALDFLALVLETDLDPGLAAELPAAVHAAIDRDPTPLLRLAQLVESGTGPAQTGSSFSQEVYTATTCNDGPFPWQSNTPVLQRSALLANALASLPASALSGFGRWSSALTEASDCTAWPVSQTPYAAALSGPYPNVPVLVIAGQFDLRGTAPEARAVVARFPKGRLLTVENAGHSVVTTALTRCVTRSIGRWLIGRAIPDSCISARLLDPLAAFPAPSSGAGASASTPAAVLALAAQTLHEAEATWVITQAEATPSTVVGVDAGSLHLTANGFMVSGYGIAGDVGLSGTITVATPTLRPPTFDGVLHVELAGATIGRLTVDDDALDGTLDGKVVTDTHLTSRLAPTPAPTLPALTWSRWVAPAGPTATVAGAIARHVGAEYLPSAGGARLFVIHAGPPEQLDGDHERPVTAIAFESSGMTGRFRQLPTTNAFGTTDTWTYAIDASAAQRPFLTPLLVLRAALEMSLYTFKSIPTISAVVVYLPASLTPDFAGDDPFFGRPALLLQRGTFATQLAEPLDKTLPLARPPFPTTPDPREQATIGHLTLPDAYLIPPAVLGAGTSLLFLVPTLRTPSLRPPRSSSATGPNKPVGPIEPAAGGWPTYYASKSPVSLELPPTWTVPPADGWMFRATDPPSDAVAAIIPNGRYPSAPAAFAAGRAGNATWQADDPAGSFSSRLVKLPSGEALELSDRFTNMARFGDLSSNALSDYLVFHDGESYNIEYISSPSHEAENAPIFQASAQTIVFATNPTSGWVTHWTPRWSPSHPLSIELPHSWQVIKPLEGSIFEAVTAKWDDQLEVDSYHGFSTAASFFDWARASVSSLYIGPIRGNPVALPTGMDDQLSGLVTQRSGPRPQTFWLDAYLIFRRGVGYTVFFTCPEGTSAVDTPLFHLAAESISFTRIPPQVALGE